MKIIYGNSVCELHNPIEAVKTIEIIYRGNIVIRHKHREVVAKIDSRRNRIRNNSSNSTLTKTNNSIIINNYSGLSLFRWIGEFRIISAKVNNKNITTEIFGVDYWNLINSNWDNAAKPEQYNGTYKFGRIPRKMASKGRKRKMLTQPSSRRY